MIVFTPWDIVIIAASVLVFGAIGVLVAAENIRRWM